MKDLSGFEICFIIAVIVAAIVISSLCLCCVFKIRQKVGERLAQRRGTDEESSVDYNALQTDAGRRASDRREQSRDEAGARNNCSCTKKKTKDASSQVETEISPHGSRDFDNSFRGHRGTDDQKTPKRMSRRSKSQGKDYKRSDEFCHKEKLDCHEKGVWEAKAELALALIRLQHDYKDNWMLTLITGQGHHSKNNFPVIRTEMLDKTLPSIGGIVKFWVKADNPGCVIVMPKD